MKVLDLQCGLQHSFEGWFASEADYADQQTRGLLTCPLCGDASIQKKLSAPRLNLKAGRGRSPSVETAVDGAAAPAPSSAGRNGPESLVDPALQGRLMQAMREVLSRTEDVGERFADQARGMHHGDIAPRNIRGQTSPDVAQELMEEGIEVVQLPSIAALKETLQ